MREPDDADAMRETRPSREPVTLDQLLGDLVAIRAAHGGGLPVLLAGEGPASHPVVEDLAGWQCVIIRLR